jgi:hypothetical protein
MSEVDVVKDISKFELRDIIDAMTHQLGHLKRSQQELLSALREEPDDVDFKTAYQENIMVIVKKQRTIGEFKAHLKTIDIVYYMEHYADTTDVAEVLPAPQPGSTAQTARESAGVYL